MASVLPVKSVSSGSRSSQSGDKEAKLTERESRPTHRVPVADHFIVSG